MRVKDNSVNIANLDPVFKKYVDTLPDHLKSQVLATSGNDAKHAKKSRHYRNKAVDLRYSKELYEYMKTDPTRHKMGIVLIDPNHGSAPHLHLSIGDGGESKLDVDYQNRLKYWGGKYEETPATTTDQVVNTSTTSSVTPYVQETLGYKQPLQLPTNDNTTPIPTVSLPQSVDNRHEWDPLGWKGVSEEDDVDEDVLTNRRSSADGFFDQLLNNVNPAMRGVLKQTFNNVLDGTLKNNTLKNSKKKANKGYMYSPEEPEFIPMGSEQITLIDDSPGVSPSGTQSGGTGVNASGVASGISSATKAASDVISTFGNVRKQIMKAAPQLLNALITDNHNERVTSPELGQHPYAYGTGSTVMFNNGGGIPGPEEPSVIPMGSEIVEGGEPSTMIERVTDDYFRAGGIGPRNMTNFGNFDEQLSGEQGREGHDLDAYRAMAYSFGFRTGPRLRPEFIPIRRTAAEVAGLADASVDKSGNVAETKSAATTTTQVGEQQIVGKPSTGVSSKRGTPRVYNPNNESGDLSEIIRQFSKDRGYLPSGSSTTDWLNTNGSGGSSLSEAKVSDPFPVPNRGGYSSKNPAPGDYEYSPRGGYVSARRNNRVVYLQGKYKDMVVNGEKTFDESADLRARDMGYDNSSTSGKNARDLKFRFFEDGGTISSDNPILDTRVENDAIYDLSPSFAILGGEPHSRGGTDIEYAGRVVEAQKGEPLSKVPGTDTLVAWGKLRNPATGNTFEKDAKLLADRENDAVSLLEKSKSMRGAIKGRSNINYLSESTADVIEQAYRARKSDVDRDASNYASLQGALLAMKEVSGEANDGVFMHPVYGMMTPEENKMWRENGIRPARTFDFRRDDYGNELFGHKYYEDPAGNRTQISTKPIFPVSTSNTPVRWLDNKDMVVGTSDATLGTTDASINDQVAPTSTSEDGVVDKDMSLADSNKLNFMDFLSEAAALVARPGYVQGQQVRGSYADPYSVSFRDRLNSNTASVNAISEVVRDPSVLANITAKMLEANNSIHADEFRANQSIMNETVNANRQERSRVEGVNTQLADTQYMRQEQARANTDAVRQAALRSASTKYAQNRAENNAIRMVENLSDFRMNEDMRVTYVGDKPYIRYGDKMVSISKEEAADIERRKSKPKGKFGAFIK